MAKSTKPTYVYTLLVEAGRKDGDGLPKDATGRGADVLCGGQG